MVATLVIPVSEPVKEWAAPVAFWRKKSVRKRWRDRRPLLFAYLGLVVGAALVLTIWVLPVVLTREPALSATERHKAITDARTGLVAMLAATGAAGGLAYTARTYRLSREGQVTDRYSKAVGQLGSDQVEVRLGGIYSLERLMRDSPLDQPAIIETLAAYVRERAPTSRRPSRVRDRRVAGHDRVRATSPRDHPAEDVQAALTALGRRRPVDNEDPINLDHTDLGGASLNEAKLAGVRLGAANQTGVSLNKANLTGAHLNDANLTGAWLNDAKLAGAWLVNANLTDAHLDEAILTGAHLEEAILTRAWLPDANLTDAWLTNANLTSARLTDARLTGASLRLADLTGTLLRRSTVSQDQLTAASHVGEIIWVDEERRVP
jgi:uncharacterized protein YjbI with pentapeptide repeats